VKESVVGESMFKDARGRGKYNVFPDVPDGQINVSYSYPGTIRAFHRHRNQFDNWFVVKGNLEVALYYPVQEKLELISLGEGDSVLEIPPFVWHGFKVLGNEEAILLYYVTNRYNPDNPDEERAEWNAFYDWQTPKK